MEHALHVAIADLDANEPARFELFDSKAPGVGDQDQWPGRGLLMVAFAAMVLALKAKFCVRGRRGIFAWREWRVYRARNRRDESRHRWPQGNVDADRPQ